MAVNVFGKEPDPIKIVGLVLSEDPVDIYMLSIFCQLFDINSIEPCS